MTSPTQRRVAVAVLAWAALAAGAAAQAPLHHAIVTRSVAAQAAFDRGLALVYAFNFQEAERAFQKASRLDPAAAMPYWGVALALGPNLNARQPTPAAALAETNALVAARQRAAELPTSPEADEERGYIDALALRLSCDPHPGYLRLEQAYGEAMGRLAARYPDDPDAATLYAESLLEQHAWISWIGDGRPGPTAQQALGMLEAVLQRWPDHIGANHFSIHAAEGAGDPGLALDSAQRLERLGAGLAGDGHLLHMPAHVYLRTGRFADAERASLAAAAGDRDYLRSHPEDTAYGGSYYLHNLSFLEYAASMDGDFRSALDAANQFSQGARRYAPNRPQADEAAIGPLAVLVRFARWQDILDLPRPDAPPFDLPGTPFDFGYAYYWHYARACALAETGEADQALAEGKAMRAAANHRLLRVGVPPLPRGTLIKLTTALVFARVAEARGNFALAAQQLQLARDAQSALAAADPPGWYPVGEALGVAWLRAGRPAEAVTALQQSLARVPGDPWAEYGLAQAWAAEKMPAQAAAAEAKFRAGWKGGVLRLEDF